MALRVTTQRRTLKGLGNGVLVLMLLWTAIPFYWMIATSLKHDKEIYGYEATLIPEQPTLANYATVFRETPYLLFLRNSMAVAVGSTIVSIVIAVSGGVCHRPAQFPRSGPPGARSGLHVPRSHLAALHPHVRHDERLRLTDSLHGLIIAYLGFDVPFCTWLLMGYFKSVPVELEEAARVDGCNRVSALVRVVLPMSLPALVVVTFFSFTHAWNEFLYAHVFTSTTGARTVTTGLVNFMSQDVFFWGPLMAVNRHERSAPGAHVPRLPALGGQGVDARWRERIGRPTMPTRREILQQAGKAATVADHDRTRGGWCAAPMRRARRSSSSGIPPRWPRRSTRSCRSSATPTPSRRGSRRTRSTTQIIGGPQLLPKLVASLEAGNPPDITRLGGRIRAALPLAGPPPGGDRPGQQDAESAGRALPGLPAERHASGQGLCRAAVRQPLAAGHPHGSPRGGQGRSPQDVGGVRRGLQEAAEAAQAHRLRPVSGPAKRYRQQRHEHDLVLRRQARRGGQQDRGAELQGHDRRRPADRGHVQQAQDHPEGGDRVGQHRPTTRPISHAR